MFRALSLWQRDVSAATPLQAGSACVSISEVNHEHRLSLAAFSAKLASVLRSPAQSGSECAWYCR
jgi:hypothetical protein